ncbi:TetR/AcrR family transcriptional regulator [Pseudoclavibacter sp. RFBA6]|uniref:TetR/AcrR family transcriptional regulator n=1 Tax=Pseudoclavibacter sp. RFBA6 TaxID=2080573 RepID=UPI000CE840D9|nr:TetR/AcrR family transcriptional regulator [Pseudoclavibacter sp. RFBA6]PPG40541.1 TetR/AcrR family transcriptional regulator [Pseudoclavibacter sp. RFBA6]
MFSFKSGGHSEDSDGPVAEAPRGERGPLLPSTKRERTRALIRDVALRSFRERGYDATTIRRIAEEAGVSVGTTNYHFATKNHLVQELYLDVQESHADTAIGQLEGVRELTERLAIVYRTGLEQLEPYHPHAPEFLAAAVSPRSPINPLSEESAPALAVIRGLFERAVDGAKSPLADEFKAGLPQVLVLSHLLLALLWVYDSSPGRERTHRILDRALNLLRMTLPLTRIPVVRAPLRELLALAGEVRA